MKKIRTSGQRWFRYWIIKLSVVIILALGGHRALAAGVGMGVQLGQFGIAGFAGNLTPGYQTVTSGTLSADRAYTQGSTGAFSAYGALTVRASYVSPDTTLTTHFARAAAYFADTVTIDAPGLTGQTGTLTFSYRLDGPLVANGPGGIDQQVKVYHGWGSDAGDGTVPSMNGYTDFNAMRSWSGWNGGSFGVFVGTMQTNTITFTYGQPFDFWLNIAVQTEIIISEPGNASAVFSLSNWSGFKGLPDGATVTSASGTDWTKSAANHFANPPVTLTSLTTGSAKIAWPTNNIGGFVLEYTPSLASPNWTTAPNAITTDNDQLTVTIDTQGAEGFYRLRRP
ncbi:MAG: hypothetical protein AB1705_09025 [Verrucomicrobiota bacterium]